MPNKTEHMRTFVRNRVPIPLYVPQTMNAMLRATRYTNLLLRDFKCVCVCVCERNIMHTDTAFAIHEQKQYGRVVNAACSRYDRLPTEQLEMKCSTVLPDSDASRDHQRYIVSHRQAFRYSHTQIESCENVMEGLHSVSLAKESNAS